MSAPIGPYEAFYPQGYKDLPDNTTPPKAEALRHWDTWLDTIVDKVDTLASGTSTTMYFDPYDALYGGVGNGIHDDTAALNAAAAAADAVGGVVDLSRGTWRITGPVKFGSCGVIGQGGNTSNACVIKCDSATAMVWIGDADAGDHYHPTTIGGFKINLNGTGDPAGRLQVYAVKARLNGITVTDSSVSGTTVASMTPGNAIWVNSAQNCDFRNITADSVQGSVLLLDNGAGGLLFSRCSFTTGGTLLRITEQTPGTGNGGGFPFGPASNTFDSCVFETRLDDSLQLMSVEAGTMNWFRACQFSASTNTARITSGALVNVTNDIVYPGFTGPFGTACGFDAACVWNGGALGAGSGAYPVLGISITGFNTVDIKSPQYVQNIGAGFVQNLAGQGTCRFDPQGVILSGSNGPKVSAGAALSNAKQTVLLGAGVTAFTLTDSGNTTTSLTPASTTAAVQTALRALASIGAGNVKVTGGSGAPFVVEFIGALAGAARANLTITPTGGTGTVTAYQVGGTPPNIVNYYNKFLTGPAASAGFTYDAATGASSTVGQFRVSNGVSRAAHLTNVSTAAFAFTADTTAYPEVVFAYVNSSCSLGTFALTGNTPVDGQEFTVTHIQPTGGGCTYVWPANVQFKGAAPSETGNGDFVRVTFKYYAATTTWIEHSRSGTRLADVPDYVPALKHRYDPASGLYGARPATQHAWRAKLGKVLAGASDAHLLVVSDSSMTGYPGGGAGSYVYDQNPARGAMRQLARSLALPWQQGLQWAIGDKSFGAADNWTLTGVFTHASVFLFCNGAGTATRAALPGETGTSVSITYSDLGTNGVPWKINGVAQTALPTGNTNTLRTTTVTGLTAGAQVIQVAPTAGQNITVVATRVWTPATKGLHLHHCGIGGSRISNATGTAAANDLNWSSTSNSGTYGLGYLVPATLTSQSITPDGILVSLGGNDLALSGDPAATATQLAVMLAAIFPSVPIVGMVHSHKVSTVTDANWNLFSGALYAAADGLTTSLFDWDAWEGGLAGAVADGLIGADGTHPTAALMQLAGVQIGKLLYSA